MLCYHPVVAETKNNTFPNWGSFRMNKGLVAQEMKLELGG